MNARKIDLMHQTFGKTDGKICGACKNLESIFTGKRTISKCKVYGKTSSEATDWAKKWAACGLYGKEWNGNEIM